MNKKKMLEQLIALLGWKEKYEFDFPEKKEIFLRARKTWKKWPLTRTSMNFRRRKYFLKMQEKCKHLQ